MKFEDLKAGTTLRWEGEWYEEFTKQDDGTWLLAEHNSGIEFLEVGMEIHGLKDYWDSGHLTVKE